MSAFKPLRKGGMEGPFQGYFGVWKRIYWAIMSINTFLKSGMRARLGFCPAGLLTDHWKLLAVPIFQNCFAISFHHSTKDLCWVTEVNKLLKCILLNRTAWNVKVRFMHIINPRHLVVVSACCDRFFVAGPTTLCQNSKGVHKLKKTGDSGVFVCNICHMYCLALTVLLPIYIILFFYILNIYCLYLWFVFQIQDSPKAS